MGVDMAKIAVKMPRQNGGTRRKENISMNLSICVQLCNHLREDTQKAVWPCAHKMLKNNHRPDIYHHWQLFHLLGLYLNGIT